ncbi:MAG: AMP-binding protein [Bdellovibrionales bacterium]
MGKNLLTWPQAKESVWLRPTRFAPWQVSTYDRLCRRLRFESPRFWLPSSGTGAFRQVKLVGLTSEAILAGAEAANRFLQSHSRDVWSLEIPTYHIGGLAILARAHLSGAKVIAPSKAKWQAKEFVRRVKGNRVTLTSLVPTQVYDLVTEQIEAPPGLRAVLVGGGALDAHLYSEARRLGWSVLPTFGMTECASQVATAPLSSLGGIEFPRLELLAHIDAKMVDGRLWLKSPSLADRIAIGNSDGEMTLEDPRRNGWLASEDMAELLGRNLKPLGRLGDVVKVKGVLVSTLQIEAELLAILRKSQFDGRVAVLSVASERDGTRFVAVFEDSSPLGLVDRALLRYNKGVSGLHRITSWCWIPELPLTELGKVQRMSVKKELGFT